MTDAIVSLAVQKLGDFLLQKIVDRINFRENLEWLRTEWGYMRSFIQDAEEKQSTDHRMQQWISEITDLAHETVTILDDFNLKMGGRKSGFANSLRTCACICSREADLYNYGQRIESLRKKVNDVSRKRETYGIRNLGDHSAGEGPSRDPNNRSSEVKTLRRTTSHVDQRLFVGLEDATQTLLDELLKIEPRRSVISIYGMGGLGKTTIARKLYHSSDVLAEFPYRAWVCVSQEYDILHLLRSLIKSFKKECSAEELKRIERMDRTDLERDVRNMLKNHKYLAVVDDVWHKEAWESLEIAFPDNENGGRVIITTRNKDVATGVDDRSFVHKLRSLTRDESWELFYKKISHGKWSAEMQNLGKRMVEKCSGLPLAILVLGGLLCHKTSLLEWQEVKENIWRQLKNNDSLKISWLLSLSYDDLPGELKKCFLYVGGFLEDCLIDVEKLKWLWMAEGFITSGVARMEEVADDYLSELINRSMIQTADTIWDKYANCRIHDLLRDLAVQKAIEVNFFDIHDPRKYSTPPSGRRHVVHRQIENYFSLALTNRQTQSLVIFNPDREEPEFNHLKSVCGNFKNLCVLHLERISFKNFDSPCKRQLPDGIGNLIHLKFLGITGTNIHYLPSSLGKLTSLETIYAKRTILAFPPEMSELKNLRHLVAHCRGPVNISSLTNLETLKDVRAEDWLKIDTTNLCNLRELVIQQIKIHCNLDSIRKLRSLTTLTLTSFGPYNSISSLEPLSSCQSLLRLGLIGSIPSTGQLKNLPRSIMFLTLQDTYLLEDPMAVLETFPKLQSLELREAYGGNTITCTAKGFPELELLLFRDLRHLRNWQLEDEAMPMIKGLGIFNCRSLVVPERINHVSKLNEMEYMRAPCTSLAW